MVIHLGPALRRDSCGLPSRPVRPDDAAWRTLQRAVVSLAGVGMFGLAPRRDCRVSRRPPRGNPRGGVLVSVAL